MRKAFAAAAVQDGGAATVPSCMSYPAADDLGCIYWYCPVCIDNGLVKGWQNTLWDGLVASEDVH
jgi:hypothetical protein